MDNIWKYEYWGFRVVKEMDVPPVEGTVLFDAIRVKKWYDSSGMNMVIVYIPDG